MKSEVLFIFITAATVIYWIPFYRFMKETGQMKDERGRRINQITPSNNRSGSSPHSHSHRKFRYVLMRYYYSKVT